MMTILSLGIVRAIFGQIVGTAIGYAIVAGIRAALGLPPDPEPAWVLGAFVGVFGSLLAAGVLTDWIKWIFGKETPLRHGPPDDRPAWTRYFGVDYNHKVIGIQYGVTSILVLMIGGILAIIFRMELSMPGMQFLSMENYNTIFSAHGIIMIASILLGVGAMGNFLVPMMIGAPDMAFPRLNAFSYWIGVPSALLLVGAMFIGGGYRMGGLSTSQRAGAAGHTTLLAWFLYQRLFLDRQRHQHYCHRAHHARARYEPLPHAYFCVGICGGVTHSVHGNADGWSGPADGGHAAYPGHAFL